MIDTHASIHTSKSIRKKIFISFLLSTVFALICWIYSSHLGTNPFGFFCDEAIIGVQSFRLLQGQYTEVFFNSSPFFYRNFHYVFGTLPLFATAPFIAIMGLSEFAVRFASSFYMLLSFIVLFLIFRKMKIRFGWIAVVVFALTPTVIHLSRVQFAQTPSLFFILLGFYFYQYAKDKNKMWFSLLSGAAFAVSMYGNAQFYIATPVFIFAVCCGELFEYRLQYKKYLPLFFTLLTAGICIIPIIHFASTSEDFFARFHDKQKQGESFFSAQKAQSIIQNYPKYYSADFLFKKGEIELPGAFITRHSVKGSGTFLPVTLLFLFLCMYAFVFKTTKLSLLVQSLILIILYPLPDILTTQITSPPYTVALFSTVLFLPFMAAAGISVFNTLTLKRNPQTILAWIVLISIVLFIFSSGFKFYFGPYNNYPYVSSDFWGWQAGPRDVLQYVKENESHYDEFYLEGAFNEPQVFLDFYLTKPSLRTKAFIGNPELYTEGKKQLFALTHDSWEKLADKNLYLLKKTVYYPDGKEAFLLVEHL